MLTACGSKDSSSSSASSANSQASASSTVKESSSSADTPSAAPTAPESSQQATKTPAEIAEILSTNITFTSEMMMIAEEEVGSFINIGNDVKASLYVVNGGTVDTLGVFEVPEGGDKLALKNAINEYIANLKENVTVTSPDEVPKLSSALITEYGNYIVLCISPDPFEATEVINSVLGIE